MTLQAMWIFAAIGAVVQTQLPAEELQRIDLWDGPAPVSQTAFEERNVRATVYHPQRVSGTAVVICPGGGYSGHAIQPEGHGIAAWLRRHGITGVVLEYRLPAGRHAVPLLDAQRAIRLVRSRAADWGIDPKRIGILGFSAGGHLASTAATHFDDGDPSADAPVDRVSCRPDFAILIYPVITMGEKTHAGSRRNLLGENPSPELIELYSNERQVTAQTPPMFLAHALDDTPVPPDNSRLLFEALQQHQIPAKFLELPSGGHGLNGYQGPMWDAWQQQSLVWLAEQKLLPPAQPLDLTDLDAVRNRRPLLIAHRGGVVTPYSPECSAAAIRKAAQSGYDLVELDLRGTKDRIPVVFHDRNLAPATDSTGRLEDFSWQELASLRYQNVGEGILTLEAALTLCKSLGLGVMLDVKDASSETMLAQVAEMVRAHGLERSAITLNSDPRIAIPLAEVSLISVKLRDRNPPVKPSRSDRALAGFFWFGLPQDLPETEIAQWQQTGALIIPAINTFRYPADRHLEAAAQDIRRLQELGVDGFQIDSVYQDQFGLAPVMSTK